LTYNEEQNIGRTLSRPTWAQDIVVVDSGSTDGTLAALARFPNVRVFNRCFDDTLVSQWRYATEETKLGTNWLLRLDADYQLSDTLTTELAQRRSGLCPTRRNCPYAVLGLLLKDKARTGSCVSRQICHFAPSMKRIEEPNF
jgi:Glycosyl transferase family 2